MQPRPDWNEFFFNIAKEVAKRSTCLRPDRQFGCVLVKDKTIISTGYNGSPRGYPHCADLGCTREGISSGEKSELCRAAHAEANAIANAARMGICTMDSELYLSSSTPCTQCAKILINAGVSKIHIMDKSSPYPHWDLSEDLFRATRVEIEIYQEREP